MLKTITLTKKEVELIESIYEKCIVSLKPGDLITDFTITQVIDEINKASYPADIIKCKLDIETWRLFMVFLDANNLFSSKFNSDICSLCDKIFKSIGYTYT